MFHQSDGCFDGSSPMCYPDGDFIVRDRDNLLGFLDAGFDKQPEGVRFLSCDRTFTEPEMVLLQRQKPLQRTLSGVSCERGARPRHTGMHIVAEAPTRARCGEPTHRMGECPAGSTLVMRGFTWC
jgi:uncharacterized protein